MQRILISLLVIGTAGIALYYGAGATGAFFSDTESSTGNTFAAGAIDLKVDNESYYNGAISSSTSWAASDLTQGLLFFNFTDIKPSDHGEDTISLHVNTNDSFLCLDMSLTSNDDKSSTEPELGDGDIPEDVNNTWDGELAQNVQMFWWADDGDNVYEVGENAITNGVQSVDSMFGAGKVFSAALADPTHNVWTPNAPGAVKGDTTMYIAKDWCFGTLTPTPVAQDNVGHTEGATNGPLVRGTGFTCNGQALNNLTQTDSMTMDVAFRAVQSRNNQNFTCGNVNPRLAKITVIKQVTNDNGGNNVVPDFHLFVDDGNIQTNVTSGITTTVTPGTYSVAETGVSGYVASFSGACDAEGNITLVAGDDKTCTITNNDLPGNITLIKNVTGAAPLADPSSFKLRVDGTLVPNTTSIAVSSNAPHTITEDAKAGYQFVSITGSPQCPLVLGGTATLNEGQAITCTITNAKNP